MSLPLTDNEALRDEEEFAEYERHVEEGYEGTFAEWLRLRLRSAPTEPCLDAPGPEEIDF